MSSVQSQESVCNQRNIEILSRAVVKGWDQNALISFALEHLEEAYHADEQCFIKDWNSYIKYNL